MVNDAGLGMCFFYSFLFFLCRTDNLLFVDCSDNGKPAIAPNCSAVCECFGGWEGQYCEIISARGGGDPHLETLDGKDIFCYYSARSKLILVTT